MKNTIQFTILTTAIFALSAMLLVPTALAQGGPPIGGSAAACQHALTDYLDLLPVGDLEPAEEQSLTFLREEEKLARDVYLTLSLSYELPIFSQIARSEQRHMDLVARVMTRHGLADPVGDNAVGVFTDLALAALFDQLVATGEGSLEQALQVGATIEDMDLADLFGMIDATDELDLDLIGENLAAGSRNHLRAFMNALTANGFSYDPQYLDITTFDDIVASEPERGVIYDEFGEVLAECGGPRQANGLQGNRQCSGNGDCDGSGIGDGSGDGHHGDGTGNDDTGSGGPNGSGDGDCDGSGPNGADNGNGSDGDGNSDGSNGGGGANGSGNGDCDGSGPDGS